MERKIYTPWAYTENEGEKSKVNQSIYQELKPKVKLFWGSTQPTKEEEQKFICYKCDGGGYSTTKYSILSNPYNFSNDELALICDRGNLCFGYRVDDGIVIYTD